MAVHIYGVVPAGTALPGSVRGRQDAELRPVDHGAVAAIVSDVDPDAPAGRADLLAHSHVLEAVVLDSTVLPMRFGVLVDTDAEVAQNVLAPAEPRLLSLLEQFDGLQQLKVAAQHDEEVVLADLLRERPDIRSLRDAIAGGGSYGEKLRLGQLVAEGVEAIARTDGDLLLDALTPLARDTVVEEPAKQHQVLEAALLVGRADRRRIDAAIAGLRRDLPDRLRLRYVGPQPPYAFLDDLVASEPVWA